MNWVVFVALFGAASAADITNETSSAKACKNSDPALNLTYIGADVWCVSSDAQLKKVCACSSIDYLSIGYPSDDGSSGCNDCTQATIDDCRIESITGAENGYGGSLIISDCPLINNLGGLSHLTGDIVGTGGIMLFNNSNLISTSALSNINFTYSANDQLAIASNPQLACVPQQWPAKDAKGNTIRNGKALHDPCLFSCNSTSGRCLQAATGIQSESSCATACATPYKCANHKCVPTPGGVSKGTCEALCT
jgi:hypothetical protein